MAIYDQSYTPWTGTYASRASRIRAIISMELALPFKSIWILLVVLLAFSVVGSWLLLLFFATSSQVLPPFAVGNRIYREGFYNFPLFSMILMVLSATVGASLISRDVRHRALLMYFSRSITRGDYLAGKYLSLLLFLLLVTLAPGVLLFLGQLGMSQERLTLGQRLGDLGSITLHSLILTLPMSSVVLGFSSMTKRTYLAAILWAAFYFVSVSLSEALSLNFKGEWPKLISWAKVTAHLGDLCYASRAPSTPIIDCGWGIPLTIVAALTVVPLVFVWWRLRSVEGEE